MNEGKTVFAQVMACVPHWEFRRIALEFDNGVRARAFSAWDHFLAMSFAQLTFRESLRDIEACLEGQPQLRHHLGLRSRVTRSTLARVNEHRPWQLFAAVATKLIPRARAAYKDEPNTLDLKAPVYALDSTFVDLSLALCPWANWTGSDATVKLHTMLDSARFDTRFCVDYRGKLRRYVLVGRHSNRAGKLPDYGPRLY